MEMAEVQRDLQFEVFISMDGMWATKPSWPFLFEADECDLCTRHSLCHCSWGSKPACYCLLTVVNPVVMATVPDFSPRMHTQGQRCFLSQTHSLHQSLTDYNPLISLFPLQFSHFISVYTSFQFTNRPGKQLPSHPSNPPDHIVYNKPNGLKVLLKVRSGSTCLI